MPNSRLTPQAVAEAQYWREKILTWPLGPESLVVEVGSYTGGWAEQMALRYGCQLHLFEPQAWAFEECSQRLGGRAEVHPFGLGPADLVDVPMARYHTDGASFVGGQGAAGPLGTGQLRDAVAVFEELHLVAIDLLMVNCEGSEYALLPYLWQAWQPQAIDHLCVQFHHVGGHNEIDDIWLSRTIEQTHVDLWRGTHTAWRRKQ